MYERARKPRITQICICGESFQTTRSRINSGHGKYCSKHCQKVGRRRQRQLACLVCGKEFERWFCEIVPGRNTFCSRECKAKFPVSTTTRQKFSNLRKGKPRPLSQGANCHFWRGGVTPVNKRIRMSLENRIWRKTVFERDDYTCQSCGERGGDLHADHVMPFALYPELRFDVLNGRTLCVTCHRKTDTWGNTHYKQNTFC